jgi:hypothetical protein
MEKNLHRVHRWIDRCIAACRNEKWDSALAEVECARAELESASEEIWERVSGSEKNYPLGRFFPLFLRSGAVALLVIMAAALPISTLSHAPVGIANSNAVRLELVTADEQSVLSALRTSLSEMNLAREIPADETHVPSAVQAATAGTERVTVEAREESSSRGLDEILALIEIGQRALRGENIIIREAPE